MMTSVGTNRARGNWEQTQTQSQTQHKQRPQATAEQIRLAQMISDHNDADFEEKVKQLIDITGKNQDECVIALHDCNGDVNRAINVLLEGNPDTDSWEMVGKKKGVSGQKDSGQTESNEEGKENRDRDRDYSRRRGGPPRRGRGASRGREFRGQENGLDGGKSGGPSGRGSERGRRGRGRGRGGSGRRGGRFSAQGMGTFNPADYAEPAGTEENYGNNSNTWNSTGSFEPDDGTRLDFIGGEGENYPRKFDTAPGTIHPGAWRTATEEWGTEDWNEDLSETKIFTASNVASVPAPQENVTITAGQRIDLAVLLGKTPASSENEVAPLDSTQVTSISQSLVFSNSKQNAMPPPPQSSGTTFSQHNMVSMLGKGFGDVGEPKGGSTSGSQFLEQFKTAQALAQLAAQHTQPSASNTASSWDMGSATQSSTLGQYDLKSQADSGVHSPFSKRQTYAPSSSMIEVFMQDKQPAVVTVSAVNSPPSPLPSKTSAAPQMSPGSSDNQSSSPQPVQQKLKQQKKKTSLTSKIPALAVEMPGSSDMSCLNLQFGALQFGSEPVLPEYESTPATSAAVSQPPSSLYTSTTSESPSTISSNQSQDSGYQSGTIQSSTFTSQNSAQGPLYEQRSTQTRRYPNSISSSPQKDLTQPKNGFNSIQNTQAVEGTTGPVVKSDPPAASSLTPLTDAVSASSLLTTANQHSTSMSSLSHSEELPSTTATQHSSSLPTQQTSLSSTTTSVRTSTSTLLHTSVESEPSLHSSSSTFSTASSTVSAAPPAASVSSSLSGVSNLSLSLSSNSTVTASTRSSVATTSGKAPPNLPPGVPPLLPNPYIMAPGLLHAYPMYGYDDLQMLPTRFPLDYYSIPFAAPTTPLAGRDGSLTSNPYSGDLTKFGRGDASSPAPATTLAQPQQSQTQTHHTTQQTFLNPALPPGYSYTSLPYYTGVPGLPSTFQYGPAMFPVAPTSSKQHSVNVNVNASATPFQQASGYGSHGYSPGVSVTSSNTGVPDISGSVYSKTQSFDKQGFHTGTPAASFNLPSALGSGGPMNPPTAAGYPAPFMHILTPHQQPHSQILHHHLQQDSQTGTGQRSQGSSIQQKSQTNKSAYNSYNWGAN
ncbi:ubiquitin-associated protein 2-like isoform X2 [Latimeria chalumnae]|uniref:ubiquitin-associated protein 2-like isoform X2 n=1 Tax=Latimeria chalumnae TaxID=7897 RepID=UPI0006D8FA36|nr:PREDICTED: ubiquitin-associated protein 2-like isoform X2 [Latimeria chalumnae]|eukprot:XP_014350086.1 PREDICTED: ubiquitin-associated protein 2-like isoform X2 [Latimeria chalumnae]